MRLRPWSGRPRRLALPARLAAIGAVVTVLVLVGGGLLLQSAAALRDAQSRQVDRVGAARTELAQLLTLYVDEETGLRGYVISGDRALLEPFDTAAAAIPGGQASLRAALSALDGPGTSALERAHERWLAYAEEQRGLVAVRGPDAARTRAATVRGKALFDTLRTEVRSLQTWLEGTARDARAQVDGLQRRLVVVTLTLLVVLVLALAAAAAVLLRSVAWPVARLAAGARAVTGGDLAAPLPAAGVPEIRSLAGDVALMRDRLTADLDVSRRSLQALEQGEPAVAALRDALQPARDAVPGLQVAARLHPAEGVLAGDWYDVLRVGRHRLAVVLGDVSGHGPRSAVLALRLKLALAAALRSGAEPGAALTATAAGMDDVDADLFATVLVATVDVENDLVVHANAGHPPALLVGRTPAGGGPAELAPTGPLLSPVVATWAWGQVEHAFAPGDVLLAVTDGILEARSPDGDQFGTGRLVAALADAAPDEDEPDADDGERVLDGLAAAVVRHTGYRQRVDDQTILRVRRDPPGLSAQALVQAEQPA